MTEISFAGFMARRARAILDYGDLLGLEPEYAAHRFLTNAGYYERCQMQARDYATAEKTDPFTFKRVMSHYANGLAYAGAVNATLWAGAEGYGLIWHIYEDDKGNPRRQPRNMARV